MSGCAVKRILFFGSDAFSKFAFEELLKRSTGLEIDCAFVCTESDFAKVAINPIILPKSLKEWSPETTYDLGLVASFGSFIPLRIMRRFTTGVLLNAHPSLLPLYRGAAPIHRTLLKGVKTSGLTILDCDARDYDAGNIWYQEECDIEGRWYLELLEYFGRRSGTLFSQIISNFEWYREKRQPQYGPFTLAPRIVKEDAEIRKTDSAEHVDCVIRAIGHMRYLYFELVDGKLLTLYDPEIGGKICGYRQFGNRIHFELVNGSVSASVFGVSGKNKRYTATQIMNMFKQGFLLY